MATLISPRAHDLGDGFVVVQLAALEAHDAREGRPRPPQWRLSRVAMPVSGLSALTVRSGLGSGRPAALGGGVAGASGLATGRT